MRLPTMLPTTFSMRSGLIVLAAITLAACTRIEPPTLSFAPYDKAYPSKLDFAQVD